MREKGSASHTAAKPYSFQLLDCLVEERPSLDRCLEEYKDMCSKIPIDCTKAGLSCSPSGNKTL